MTQGSERQSLLVLQSLWAMDRSGGEAEPALERKIEQIAAASYDGLATDCDEAGVVRRVMAAARSLDLVVEGQCTPRTDAAFRASLELAAEHGLHHLVVQPAIPLRSVAESVEVLATWQSWATSLKADVLIETHRGRLTNDLPFTLQLMDRLPATRFLADLSHYVVGREMELPVTSENEMMVQRLLDRASGFHGRVASSEQVQIEISFPQHARWLELFLRWWEYGFRSWRGRAPKGASLTFTCELGPRPYAVTDALDRDSTDRWDEAKIMARLVRELWQTLDSEDSRLAADG